MIELIAKFKGTILHPQWLTDRYHIKSRTLLKELENFLILDIGSGDGKYLKYIEEKNNLIRLDYPRTNIRYRGMPDVYGDASALSFASNSIDVILFFEVFEHVKHEKLAIEEIHRVLKKNGLLFMSVPFIYPAHDLPFDYRRLTIYGFRKLLSESGFRITKEIQHGNSFVVSIQLFSLALLESVSKSYQYNKIAGYVFGIISYPVCIFTNIVATLFLKLDYLNRSSFGYLIVAEVDK